MIKVTCAIIENKGKVLVAQRSEKMHPPLKWEFPGGKIHSTETAEECIIREIKEELNLKVEIISRLKNNFYKYDIKTIDLIPFRVKYISGDIILLEHQNAKWILPDELNTLDMAEADIPIIKDYLKIIGT
ncbi:MAG: (deoxy)nucleoside triphosphate pyrophosphohydrolase [Melioribacteraceae bacterium]|nr:(deoxy)nucleoside triphosphate pyrophosphohydrolase [Melioribacteraceae bacterium]